MPHISLAFSRHVDKQTQETIRVFVFSRQEEARRGWSLVSKVGCVLLRF